MELHMHSHHFARRMPDWRAAVIGGCVAGVVFLAIEMLAMQVAGRSLWDAPRMIAAIVTGRNTLAHPAMFEPDVMLVALVVDFALSILFAVILAAIIAPFSLDSSVGMASLVGAVFGAALYVINFYGMTRWFPWFADVRNWASLFSHVVFGLVASDTYLRLEGKKTGTDATDRAA
ncbi:hypothetical protein KY49_2085 [Burkholderia sp. MSHR3999]|uniref:membrane protein n=1 Tax=Burkholderia sp. MSHR3999 TaxID=1542965 RepID=UPI0005ABEB1F|nr:membrane protein [Burkholderia sp. MSHR3999]KIP13637.1 hypothetical protein KY49_2085 [Burkholderia sp. MSHR3999]